MNEQSSQTSGISQQILGKLLAKARVPTDSEVWCGVKSAGADRGLEGKLPSLGAAAASLPQTLRLASGVECCLACERVRRRLGGAGISVSACLGSVTQVLGLNLALQSAADYSRSQHGCLCLED